MSYPVPVMPRAMQRPNFPPSPPDSVQRHRNGPAPMSAHNGSDHEKHAQHSQHSQHPPQLSEDHLYEHHRTLTKYLAASAPAQDGQTETEPHHRARDKLLRLSTAQFSELSTDVYDELLRREHDRRHPPNPADSNYPRFLLPRPHFHPKRNQARQKLASLITVKFRELASDVLFELDRRYPQFTNCLLYTSPSPRDGLLSRMPSSA